MGRDEHRIPPPDVRASRFEVGGDEYAVISFRPGVVAENPALTQAESEVLGLVLQGQSNAAVARSRGTSPRTIANQVASILRKLGVRSRAELASTLERGDE